MSEATVSPDSATAATRRAGSWNLWSRFSQNRAAVIGLSVIGVFVLAALLAPLLVPAHYVRVGLAPTLSPPNWPYLMGTDDLGRNVLAGVLYGGRVSLMVGAVSVAVSTLIGIVLGLLAGYNGGLLDEIFMRVVEFFQVLPRFFVALILVAIIGSSMWNVIIVIAALSWPLTARLVRAEVLSLRERDFVQALKLLRAPAVYIAFIEILPNALAPVVVNATLEVGRAILTEASLSFLGLGDADNPSWGFMLSYAQPLIRQAWWLSVFPGIAIVLAVLGCNLIGDGLNDVLNPRRDAVTPVAGPNQ